MSETAQVRGYDGAVQGHRSSTSTVGRKQSAGNRFIDIFRRLLGSNGKRPVAYVRNGREVSFEKIPFVDSDGARLNIAKGADGKTVIRRKGRLGANSKTVDAVLRREKALSGNRGVARAVPQFRSRAYKHLKETENLRQGIINGELETPGNKSARLLKKLKAEQADEGLAVDTAWLEQVKQHLNRTRGNGAANLKAAAAALKSAGGKNSDAELQDPRLPRVKKFSPERVVADETDHIVNALKGKAKKAVADNGDAAATMKVSSKKKSDKTANSDREVVQRISIQKEKSIAAPGETESRSLQIVRQLKKGANGTSPESGKLSADKEQPKDAHDSVNAMRRKGWRVHTPFNNRAQRSADESSGDALRGSRQLEKTAKDAAVPATNTEGQEPKQGQDESAKPSDLARVQAAPIPAAPQSSAHQGDNSSQQAQTSNTNAQQDASRGLQNLNQLLTQMETSARVLIGNGRTTMTVRLYPPELGSLNVKIRVSNGRYEVTMDAENEKALRTIEKQIPTIRQHLNDRGIHVDQIQVRQGGDGEANAFADQFEEHNSPERPERKGRPRGRAEGVQGFDEAAVAPASERAALQLGTNTMEVVG